MVTPARILQVGTMDEGGGAATVASGLARGYRARGCRVWHLVGRKGGDDADTLLLPDDHRLAFRLSGYSAVQRRLKQLAGRYPNRGWGLASRSLRMLTHPRALSDRRQGIEDFEFPGTADLLDLVDESPQILHCHNLHGGYFDVRALSALSRRVPTIVTLHDMWLLTGHCAYSLTCDRWTTGCGACPDLNLYPAVQRDATAFNWTRKRDVFAGSQLYVATPSTWLMDMVGRSMLAPAVREARTIPNGVDLSVFRPADKRGAKSALGLPPDEHVVLTTAGSRGSMWKDTDTIARLIKRAGASPDGRPIVFIALGVAGTQRMIGRARVQPEPYQTDPRVMARYYQAADIYAHAARADNFPSAILEALACGTPVVATEVGGISEQIRSTSIEALAEDVRDTRGGATGILVPRGDADRMAEAIEALFARDSARHRMGENAAHDARARFDLEKQIDAYLAWYRAILDAWPASPQHRGS